MKKYIRTKFFIVFASMFLYLLAYGQEHKTKTKYSKFYIEKFEITKTDKKKDGKYLKLLLQTKDTLVIGNYNNDTKVGLWVYKTDNHQNYLIYNFDNSKIVYLKPEMTTDSFFIKSANEFVFDKIDTPPLYLDYHGEIDNLLANTISLPTWFFEKKVADYSLAYIVVNKFGDIDSIGVEKSLDKQFDDNIIRSLKLIKEKWIPAKVNDNFVDSKIYFLINVSPDNPKHLAINKPFLHIVDIVYYNTVRTERMATRSY